MNEIMAERMLLELLKYIRSDTASTRLELATHKDLEQTRERILYHHLVDVEEADRNYRARTAEILRSLADSVDPDVSRVRLELIELHRKDSSVARFREGLLSDLSSGLASKVRQPAYDWRSALSCRRQSTTGPN